LCDFLSDFLSEPGFTGYEGFSGWQADV